MGDRVQTRNGAGQKSTKAQLSRLLLLTLPFALTGCFATPVKIQPDQHLADSIDHQPAEQTLTPLIIEWAAADRGALEARMADGVVAVKVTDQGLTMLGKCVVPGQYTYRGFTRKLETKVLSTLGELDANFSMGAVKLGPALKRFGKLLVTMNLVGRFEAKAPPSASWREAQTCRGATHLVSGASTGAFRFYAGEGRDMEAGLTAAKLRLGARNNQQFEFASEDGAFDSCESAKTGDVRAPEGCGALVQLELSPIAQKRNKRQPPQFQYGRLTFFNAQSARDRRPQTEQPVEWHRGPIPARLCEQLTQIPADPSFMALLEYCHASITGLGDVLIDGVVHRNKLNWFLYDLPENNFFTRALENSRPIMAAANRNRPASRQIIVHLFQTMMATLYWHATQPTTADKELADKAAGKLHSLERAVDLDALDDARSWWAAHLLTLAGMADYSAQLARMPLTHFATKWHIARRFANGPDEALEQYWDGQLDKCDPFRLDIMEMGCAAAYAQTPSEQILKKEISLAMATEQFGDWGYPGSGVYQLAADLGLLKETEQYIRDHQWVLGDFLWDGAISCFEHQDFLCERRYLQRILTEAPLAPVAPLAEKSLIELEYAMGNRAAGFKKSMEATSYKPGSLWWRNAGANSPCAAADQIDTIRQTALARTPKDEQVERRRYDLVGQSLPKWRLLTSLGAGLTHCLSLRTHPGELNISIDYQGQDKTPAVSTTPNADDVTRCLSDHLPQWLTNPEHPFSVQIAVLDTPTWHTNWATGWSELDRYQMACDAGQVEGCFQLGLTLSADPTPSLPISRKKAREAFKKGCTAGHNGACEALSMLFAPRIGRE